MPKFLKVSLPQKCIGCELCVHEAQRQLGKIGLEGSLVRIFKDKDRSDTLQFKIELDPRINNLDIEKIKDICPTGVFTLEDNEAHHELTE